MTGPRTIVCLSSQPWDDDMWTNKQHVMSRVAKQHRVVFVNFGNQSPFKFVARAKARAPSSGVGLHNAWWRPAVQRLGPSLEVLDIWTPPWFSRLRHGRRLRERYEFEHRLKVLRRWLLASGITDAVIWVYHPGYGDSVKLLPHSIIVYDCVDEYSAFPEFRLGEEWIRRRERALCEAAAVVTCTAPALYESKRQFAPDRTHLVHNVGDAEHFAKAMDAATEVPADIATVRHPVIGFVGALSDYKLDIEWLLKLAQARPDVSIVLIGPVGVADPSTDVGRLTSMPNIKLLGHRSYDTLPGYLKGFDVAVIPYRINDYTRAVFPIKFFEFLGSGRPVVISALPAVREYWSAVRVANTAEDFIEQCAAALKPEAGGAQLRRLELARDNSWPERVRKLLALVDAALERR